MLKLRTVKIKKRNKIYTGKKQELLQTNKMNDVCAYDSTICVCLMMLVTLKSLEPPSHDCSISTAMHTTHATSFVSLQCNAHAAAATVVCRGDDLMPRPLLVYTWQRRRTWNVVFHAHEYLTRTSCRYHHMPCSLS
jgi:hypothetical protein